MNQEILQELTSIYTALFQMTVTGDSVVPMASVLLQLRAMIGRLAVERETGIEQTEGEPEA